MKWSLIVLIAYYILTTLITFVNIFKGETIKDRVVAFAYTFLSAETAYILYLLLKFVNQITAL